MAQKINKKKAVSDLYIEISENPLIRATIQSIPNLGSALDTLLFHKAQKIKEQRLQELLTTLKNSMSKLDGSKIDKDYIQSEEFLFIVEQIFIKYVQESHTQKREYYRNILVNSSTKTFSGYHKEVLLNIMSNLSEFHLTLLTNITECTSSSGVISARSLQKIGYGKDVTNHLMFLSSTGVVDRFTEVSVDGDYDDVSADTSDYFKISHLGNEVLVFISEF